MCVFYVCVHVHGSVCVCVWCLCVGVCVYMKVPVYVCFCVSVCIYVKVTMEALDLPGAEVRGSCEHPRVGPGNQTQIGEAVCTANH